MVEQLQIRYADLDTYGHVNNAVHLSYFEGARVAYMKALAELAGLPTHFEAWGENGGAFVLAQASVTYRAPVRLDDGVLWCGISIRSVSRRSFVWDYDLRASEEGYEAAAPRAEGSTVQVFYDQQKGISKSRPDWFLPAVAAFEGRPEESFALEPR